MKPGWFAEAIYSVDDVLWLLEQTRPKCVAERWEQACRELAARAQPDLPAGERELRLKLSEEERDADFWRRKALALEKEVARLRRQVA